MSDWIEHDGKKYFEESYLKLANEGAITRLKEIDQLRADLATERERVAGLEAQLTGERRLRDSARTARESAERERAEAMHQIRVFEDYGTHLSLIAAELGVATIPADSLQERCCSAIAQLQSDSAELAAELDMAFEDGWDGCLVDREKTKATLAAHNARLTAPLERRVGELTTLLERCRKVLCNKPMGAQSALNEDICAALASTPREGTGEPQGIEDIIRIFHKDCGGILTGSVHDPVCAECGAVMDIVLVPRGPAIVPPADPPADREQIRREALEPIFAAIRKSINDCLGGMGSGSAIWSNNPWNKGHTAGVLSAITAFDTQLAAELRRLAADGGSGNAKTGQ